MVAAGVQGLTLDVLLIKCMTQLEHANINGLHMSQLTTSNTND